jgi:hypothetical protein
LTVDAISAKKEKLEEDLEERSKAYELELAHAKALEAKLNALKSSSAQQIAHLQEQLAAVGAGVRGKAGRQHKEATLQRATVP